MTVPVSEEAGPIVNNPDVHKKKNMSSDTD